VRDERRGQLLALQADGHYLNVHTDAGCDMILYRFSDALNELSDSEGMRVHRSWWVAERAVERMENGEKLVLVNGITLPVSRSYRVQVRERGWLS
jgi:DNA-binding LytR/AlgR family response regulator